MTTSRQSPRMLPLYQLVGHADNPRDEVGDVSELAASIRQHGLIQPIVVSEHPRHPGEFLVLSGHRRVAAARSIPLEQVICIVRHDAGTPDDQIAMMLVENMQRRNLNPVERARAMKKLISSGMTQSDVARRIGVTPATVNNTLLLLDLSDEELAEIEAGDVNLGDARAAVRTARKQRRTDHGERAVGRPAHTEPRHFTRAHPLAEIALATCTHTQRPYVDRSVLACGQCWEQAIRDDALSSTTERKTA